MTVECPRCHAENNDSSRFCSTCAAPLGPGAGAGPESASLTETLQTPVQVMRPGTVIAGKYRVAQELGRGGMGVVYKAEDTRLQRTVALKFLPPELTHIPEIRDRFRQEAKAAAALDHPNICTIYDFDQAEDRAFISMAYIEGRSLRKRIDAGPLELEEALKIAAQVAEGLEEAHGKGIVHRDVKSANIMVTPKGQAKVMDFGLARVAGATLVTQEGTTMGTVSYMSPEQARGEKVDHRTDIWSFGVVLYEMLTGELPFKGEQSQAVIYAILKEKPKPLTSSRPDLPLTIEQVVLKALEKDPDRRYQRFEDILDDLRSITAGIVPDEIKARLRRARIAKRKRALLFGGTAAVVIVAVLALLVLTRRSQAIESVAILPLENLTGDAEKDYYVDGVTDELIGHISRISGLRRVISRTSMMLFKGSDKPVPEIARELRVDAVVEGAVYRVGDSVRLRLQLIDALPEERSLWTETYERPGADVLMMYGEIARTIAGKLQVKLTAEEETRFAKARQVDLEVYEAYLKARSYWQFMTKESLNKALEFLNSAVAKNPGWAPLYAGLADVWMWIQQCGYEPPSVTAPKIYENLNKALELDPDLAEAHYLNALIAKWVEWNWEKSEKAFLKALAINPNDGLSRMLYAQLLLILHRKDEALAQRQLAIGLDPLNPNMRLLNVGTLIQAGEYKTALSLAEEALAAEPAEPTLNGLVEIAAYKLKEYDKVIRAMKYSLQQYPLEEDVYERIVRIYRESGIVSVYQELLKHLEKFAENNYMAFSLMAFPCLATDQPDKAMDWIEKGFEMHDPQMVYLTTPARIFEPLFGNPRFMAICKKMNLPLPK